jgi:hypothetical protein
MFVPGYGIFQACSPDGSIINDFFLRNDCRVVVDEVGKLTWANKVDLRNRRFGERAAGDLPRIVAVLRDFLFLTVNHEVRQPTRRESVSINIDVIGANVEVFCRGMIVGDAFPKFVLNARRKSSKVFSRYRSIG